MQHLLRSRSVTRCDDVRPFVLLALSLQVGHALVARNCGQSQNQEGFLLTVGSWLTMLHDLVLVQMDAGAK